MKIKVESIQSRRALQDYVNSGHKVKFLHFWGHRKSKAGTVTKSCFSQWYPSRITEDGVQYASAEHYMMAAKARLFKDDAAFQKITECSDPGKAKALGRQVKGFNESVWLENREEIVRQASFLKFSQNKELKEFLLLTGKRVLVEASPVDKIWGVGMSEDNDGISNPSLWRGLNLLGFALMKVRVELN